MSLTSPYVSNIPQGNQQVNSTQMPIKNNFYDIYYTYAVNHVPFNTPNDFGKHFNINYYNQNSDAGGVASAISLYSKAVTDDLNLLELFYQYPNGSVAQLNNTSSPVAPPPPSNTNGGIEYSTSPVAGYAGYQYLSGSVLMKFGLGYVPFNTSAPLYTVNFPTSLTIPAFTQTPYIMQYSVLSGNAPTYTYQTLLGVAPISATQYQIKQATNYATGYFYWLAIGK